MPVYEYECSKCGQVFEEFHRLHDDFNLIECPRCGAWYRDLFQRWGHVVTSIEGLPKDRFKINGGSHED